VLVELQGNISIIGYLIASLKEHPFIPPGLSGICRKLRRQTGKLLSILRSSNYSSISTSWWGHGSLAS